MSATPGSGPLAATIDRVAAMTGAETGDVLEAVADYGRFVGMPVRVEFGDDGRSAHLLEQLSYVAADGREWTAPKGAWLDGASIPRAFWSVIGGPFEGLYREASIIHDHYCVARSEPWQDVHRMFWQAMLCRAVPAFKARIMYYAVYRFGPRWPDPGGLEAVSTGGLEQPAPLDDTTAASIERDAQVLAAEDMTAEQIEALADRSR